MTPRSGPCWGGSDDSQAWLEEERKPAPKPQHQEQHLPARILVTCLVVPECARLRGRANGARRRRESNHGPQLHHHQQLAEYRLGLLHCQPCCCRSHGCGRRKRGPALSVRILRLYVRTLQRPCASHLARERLARTGQGRKALPLMSVLPGMSKVPVFCFFIKGFKGTLIELAKFCGIKSIYSAQTDHEGIPSPE